MKSLAFCGIALLCFSSVQILGRERGSFSLLLSVGGCLCILCPAVFSLPELFDRVRALTEQYRFQGADLLIKAFGIGLCFEITEDLCREGDCANLANALNFSCKITILLLCIPLLKEIFEVIEAICP